MLSHLAGAPHPTEAKEARLLAQIALVDTIVSLLDSGLTPMEVADVLRRTTRQNHVEESLIYPLIDAIYNYMTAKEPT